MSLIRCTECGETVSDKAGKCPHCGCPLGAMSPGAQGHRQSSELSDLRLETPQLLPGAGHNDAPIEEYREVLINEKFYKAALGKNLDYYLVNFRKIATGTLTVNIAAFFFTCPWLMYRKMYINCFIYFLISFSCNILIALLIDNQQESVYYVVVSWVVIGIIYMFVANTFYKEHVDKIINFAKIQYGTEQESLSWLRYKGGTSKVSCCLGIVILAGLGIFAEAADRAAKEEAAQMQRETARKQQPVGRPKTPAPPLQQAPEPTATLHVDLNALRQRAARGDVAAQAELGMTYYHGRGVARDYGMALNWFRQAAARGHASSQNNLGWMYANGQGVKKDDRQAVQWWRKAAAQGNAMAQSNLGAMCYYGRGTPQDSRQAVTWWRKAAAQGNGEAQEFLRGMGLQ